MKKIVDILLTEFKMFLLEDAPMNRLEIEDGRDINREFDYVHVSGLKLIANALHRMAIELHLGEGDTDEHIEMLGHAQNMIWQIVNETFYTVKEREYE